MDDILTCQHISAGYGRITVLSDLSLRVERGQTLGIIGPNGSGKTTLLHTLSGMIFPSRGKIRFEGQNISSFSPDARCRLGIGRTFQVPRPFSRMKVFENALTAAAFGNGGSRRDSWTMAEKALDRTHLTEKRDMPAGELNLLDRKRLEIARAISTNPKVLLLDEIAAGLTSAEVTEILDIVGSLKEDGLTVVWIEHIMETMLQAADTLICMAEGKIVISGPPAEVLGSREVEQLYLGKMKEDARHAEG